MKAKFVGHGFSSLKSLSETLASEARVRRKEELSKIRKLEQLVQGHEKETIEEMKELGIKVSTPFLELITIQGKLTEKDQRIYLQQNSISNDLHSLPAHRVQQIQRQNKIGNNEFWNELGTMVEDSVGEFLEFHETEYVDLNKEAMERGESFPNHDYRVNVDNSWEDWEVRGAYSFANRRSRNWAAEPVDQVQLAVRSNVSLPSKRIESHIIGKLKYSDFKDVEDCLKILTIDLAFKPAVFFSPYELLGRTYEAVKVSDEVIDYFWNRKPELIGRLCNIADREYILKRGKLQGVKAKLVSLYLKCGKFKDRVFPVVAADYILQEILRKETCDAREYEEALQLFAISRSQLVYLNTLIRAQQVLPEVRCNCCNEDIRNMHIETAGFDTILAKCSRNPRFKNTIMSYCRNCEARIVWEGNRLCRTGECGGIIHRCSKSIPSRRERIRDIPFCRESCNFFGKRRDQYL